MANVWKPIAKGECLRCGRVGNLPCLVCWLREHNEIGGDAAETTLASQLPPDELRRAVVERGKRERELEAAGKKSRTPLSDLEECFLPYPM